LIAFPAIFLAMTHDLVINSKDGTSQGAYSKDGDLWNVNSQQVDSYTQGLKGLEDGLPANDPADHLVHWNGSSYSGADIKIVVHMYDEIATQEEALLNEDEIFYRELVDAYNTLYLNVDNIVETSFGVNKLSISDVVIGLYPAADTRVIGHIQQFIRTFSGVPKDSRASIMRTSIDANISDYQALSESANNQLADVKEAKKGSHTTFTLATAQTFSIQSHREKHAVRALGHTNAKGHTRGQRTIAGSVIFTMFNEHALAGLMRAMGKSKNKYDPTFSVDDNVSSLMIDQLPPIDLTIVFANEYGSLSRAAAYGVEFMNSGVTLSIEDLLTEEVVNFVARDMDPVISQGRVGTDRKQRGMHFNAEGKETTGSDLVFANQSAYAEYLGRLGVRRSLRNR
jgi:hypothetical protein